MNMKKITNLIIPIFIAAIVFGCKDQQKAYEITGTVATQDASEYVVLLDLKRDTLEKAKIVDGKFHIKGQVERPQKAFISLEQNRPVMFILANDTYTVKVDTSKSVNVLGGELNTLVYGYKQQGNYKKALNDLQQTSKRAFSGIDMMDEEAVTAARKISSEKRRVVRTIVNKYQSNILEGDSPVYAKLFTLSENYDWKQYDIDEKLVLYDAYEKEIGKDPFLQKMKQLIKDQMEQAKIAKTVDAGSPFKEIIAIDVNGKKIKLSEVIAKNKYTLLEMWASWCGPCRGEFPHLKKAYKEYHGEGFEIYALSLDSVKEEWLKALKEEDVPWINTVDYKAFESETAKKYGIRGIPASFLISSDGTIVASYEEVRGFALDEKLKELFGK